jgi:catechol 2,3-dioxygenase-like lactoylglutathione lyase family enzyme
VVRIRSLTLATNDLRAQSAFWGGRLGVPVRDEAGALVVELRDSVIRFQRARPGVDARYHFAFNVPRGQIEAAQAWVAERHVVLAFHGDPDEPDGTTVVHTDRGASAFYFLDSGGNVVELIANDNLDNDSPGSFSAGSLLEIAEIGIASRDTALTSRAVRDALGADVLWGGRPPSLLTAIGDDHGVVIVAPVGRGWIPVGLEARPLPTVIEAEAPAAGEVILPEGPYRLRAVAH